jgi:hypothetical protein
MTNKPIVVTTVTLSIARNDKWPKLLACKFETEDGNHLEIHLTKTVVESLGVDPKIIAGALEPGSGLVKFNQGSSVLPE